MGIDKLFLWIPNDTRQKKMTNRIPVEENSGNRGPESWVDLYGDTLYRYALLRVRDPVAAEEVVQETFLSAIQSLGGFEHRSAEKTWLIAILKHKILDYHRRTAVKYAREESFDSFSRGEKEAFAPEGAWADKPGRWSPAPDELYDRNEFREILVKCLSYISPRAACVFTMKEMDGDSTGKICKDLGITPTNLWVMLYRARMSLRKCLEKRWFKTDGA